MSETTAPGGQPLSTIGSVTEGVVTVGGTGVSGLDSSEVPISVPVGPAPSLPIAHRVNVTAVDTVAGVLSLGTAGAVLLDILHSYVDFICEVSIATSLASVTINAGGSAYTNGTYNNVAFTGGGSPTTAPTAKVTVAGGSITAIDVSGAGGNSNPGAGLSSVPTLVTTGLGAGSGLLTTAVLTVPTAAATLVPFLYDSGAAGGEVANWEPLWDQICLISYTPGQGGSFPGGIVRVQGVSGYLILGVVSLSAQTRLDIDAIKR